MKRLVQLALGMLGVLIVMAVSASAALAVQPSNLPEGVKTFGGSGLKTEFNSEQGTIECASAAAENSSETGNEPPSGSFHIDFKTCKNTATLAVCTGLGEASGVILSLGTWKLVFDRKVGGATELTTATLFEVSPTHFNCTALVLTEVKGEMLCLDKDPTTSSTVHHFLCSSGKREAQEEEYCKGGESGGTCIEPVLPSLLESINHAAFKGAVELAEGTVEYGVAVVGMV